MIITFVWEYTSTVYCSECGANIILHYVLVLTPFNPDVRLNLIERTLPLDIHIFLDLGMIVCFTSNN